MASRIGILISTCPNKSISSFSVGSDFVFFFFEEWRACGNGAGLPCFAWIGSWTIGGEELICVSLERVSLTGRVLWVVFPFLKVTAFAVWLFLGWGRGAWLLLKPDGCWGGGWIGWLWYPPWNWFLWLFGLGMGWDGKFPIGRWSRVTSTWCCKLESCRLLLSFDSTFLAKFSWPDY